MTLHWQGGAAVTVAELWRYARAADRGGTLPAPTAIGAWRTVRRLLAAVRECGTAPLFPRSGPTVWSSEYAARPVSFSLLLWRTP